MTRPLTLFDKIWAQHEILQAENGLSLMWVDRHYIHEGSFQGFDKVEARQARLHLIKQEDILKAVFGNPKYYQACGSLFGCTG